MPLNDYLSGAQSGRYNTGYSQPGYKPPKPVTPGASGYFKPHEQTSFFEGNPQSALNAFSPQFGGGTKKRALQSSLGAILDQYKGGVARNLLEGNPGPAGGFVDFLGGGRGYDKPFDFDAFYQKNFSGLENRSDAQYKPSYRYI